MSRLAVTWPCGLKLEAEGFESEGWHFRISTHADELDCPLHGQTCPNGRRPPRPPVAPKRGIAALFAGGN